MINDKVFSKFPILRTDRCVLRGFVDDDASALFSIRGDSQIMFYMDSDLHKDQQDSLELIRKMRVDYKSQLGINWAIESLEDQRVIGYIGFWKIDKKNARGEIGYALHSDHWGKGLMSEELLQIVLFGFDELGLHSIEANTNESNFASQALLEKIGFNKEAHFRENYYYNGQYLDSVIYGLLRSDLT